MASRSKAVREGRVPLAPGRPATAQPAMQAQNYRALRETCGRCKHKISGQQMPSEYALKFWPDQPEMWKTRMVWTGKKCGIGGFSVRDSATCDLFERAQEDEPA